MQLPDYSSANVLVAGDLMLDRYWHGGTSRISPEAPVPVVHVKEIEERVGGAGNVALNVAALKARVSVLGFSGDDEAADVLVGMLENAGVRCLIQRQANQSTITKLRVLSRHQQLIRLDFEDGFLEVDETQFLEMYKKELKQADVVVLSDYGKGTLKTVSRLIDLAAESDTPVLVDPKGFDFSKYRGATLLTPNWNEFETVVGRCGNQDVTTHKGRELITSLQLDALLVTRGEDGMTLLEGDAEPLHLSADAREVYDVTGAGDTVISTLAASLAAGKSMAEATALANVAAGVVVGKLGTATIPAEELEYAIRGQRAHHRGVIEINSLLEALAIARNKGEKIVATNGCFDILHLGHIQYLKQARNIGDRLVVLVNSDASVKRLKGPSRPINSLDQRMAMLAALECVDWVVPFEEDTPQDVICRVLPDILVKGGDYKDIKEIAGHDCVLANGGDVKLLGFVDGFSTTGIIESIQDLS
ncbi:MAG: bifunctional D-glycero-beta-D-manno-heptose-7-phosphate kinase/D-glycero-beta-D-manno-heptose 1-phosphate adenylyltransferase HldE [Methylococcales bacterium]